MVPNQRTLACRVNPFVSIDPRAFHFTIIGRNAPRTEQPSDHVGGFRVMADEIKNSTGVLPIGDRIGFEGVHQVREFQRITNEEHFEIITH